LVEKALEGYNATVFAFGQTVWSWFLISMPGWLCLNSNCNREVERRTQLPVLKMCPSIQAIGSDGVLCQRKNPRRKMSVLSYQTSIYLVHSDISLKKWHDSRRMWHTPSARVIWKFTMSSWRIFWILPTRLYQCDGPRKKDSTWRIFLLFNAKYSTTVSPFWRKV
jgi:hypothetical protein